MSDISPAVLFGVELTTDQLAAEELSALVKAIKSDGYDLKQLDFYEKIVSFFVGNDTMHSDVKEAIIILAGRRLQG